MNDPVPALRPLLGALIPVPSLPPAEGAALASLQRVIDDAIAPAAVTTDSVGRYPTASVAALKNSGILKASVPAAWGGLGASHRLSLEAQVRLAAADSSVAQLFKIHDELTREIFVYCPDATAPRLATAILREEAILGLAVAENGATTTDPLTTRADRQPDGSYVINGTKIYTTGAAEADYIATWAFDPVAGAGDPVRGMVLNLVAQGSAGVEIRRDWDALGQRGTDSGTVAFTDVRTDPGLLAVEVGRWPVSHAPLLYQAGFAAVLVGIGIGALGAAIDFVATKSRPWPSAGADSAAGDVLVRRLAGELAADLAGAYALVASTAELFDLAAAGQISRTEVAIPVYAAKSAASRAGLRATSEVFALMGTRSTAGRHGFDRWWRNARTLSLHDPVDWKHAEIGAHLLSAWDPPFGVYT